MGRRKKHKPPIIAPSAHKHGISDEDMLHAYYHAIRTFVQDEGFTMVIGPSKAGVVLLEVGYIRGAQPVIIHAMRANKKYLRQLR